MAKDGQETEIKEKDVSDAMGTDDTQLAIQGKDTQYTRQHSLYTLVHITAGGAMKTEDA